jgi:CubicO group peptidase (beta-lactamase class C family)
MVRLILSSFVCLALSSNSFSQQNEKSELLTGMDLFGLQPDVQLKRYANFHLQSRNSTIKAGTISFPLKTAKQDLQSLSFMYMDTLRTFDEFLRKTRVVGIVVIKDNKIIAEQYLSGTSADTKWVDFSVAKSIASLLYGAAIKDGYIKSLEEPVSKFIPEIKGSVYDSVSLKTLLQMTSGVGWIDDVRSPNSDLFKMMRIGNEGGGQAVYSQVKGLKRKAPEGTVFNYNTMEAALAGIILNNVTKRSLSEYLSERIWKPFGMESDAHWLKLNHFDVESAGGCVSATLRDHARIGLVALNNGITPEGKKIFPDSWMKESTSPSKAARYYGYFWWLRPNGRFFASGSFGQQVEIDPNTKTVIAVHSYWPIAFSDYYIGYLDTAIDAILKR